MNKKWNVDILGVLATAEEMDYFLGKNEVFINNTDTLQFYIKILSQEPDNFPRHIKLVTCYADELVNWGFEDDITLPRDKRVERLKDFLKDVVIVFRPEMRKGQAQREFYVAKDVQILPKNDSFRNTLKFIPIPIFSNDKNSSNRSKDEFEEALKKPSYVGKNNQVSQEENDTPNFVVWKEGEKFIAYGEFESHVYAYGGFRFTPLNNEIRKTVMKEDWIQECYIHNHVIFVENSLHETIVSAIRNGELLENKEIQRLSEQQEDIRIGESTGFERVENEIAATTEAVDLAEREFLERFIEIARDEGLHYHEEDLYNFHTAMKTGGLVILAGMSGTGKSKLVQVYSKALKLSSKQTLFIPVRPFWQDDSDVIGYVDTLNNVYRPGDCGLVNLLIEASNDTDNLYIVCFDEMNLARVEHYFSQFLSVLELEEGQRKLQLYNEEYSNRLHNYHLYPPSVPIKSNVMFVGTVNIDESTYHFSDKVLDRANVINLQLQPYEVLLTSKPEKKSTADLKERMSADIYASFRNKDKEIGLTREELKFLWNLHNAIQEANRNIGIGWRIVKQIGRYMKNLVPYSPLTRQRAFDLQIAQRVMTKIRGSEEQLANLVGVYNKDTGEVEKSQLLLLLDEASEISDFQTVRKIIKEKAKELKLHGYTV